MPSPPMRTAKTVGKRILLQMQQQEHIYL
jgi:hypothetical protein